MEIEMLRDPVIFAKLRKLANDARMTVQEFIAKALKEFVEKESISHDSSTAVEGC